MQYRVLYYGLITVVVGGTIFQYIRDWLVSREPKLIKVRHVEDTHGDPYTVLDTAGLIEQHGYPAEQHNMTTEDGYNIVIYRIPGSPKSPSKERKPIVFLAHGLLASSDIWLLSGPEFDLPYLLADEGYDVWLGNYRGNTYARSHINLTTLNKEFWNFSFHEIGKIDVPNTIDYILEYSGQKKLFYIGHSLGVLASYVMLTERPEYNDKIILAISFGPPANWYKHPARYWMDPWLIRNLPWIEWTLNKVGIDSFSPQSRLRAVLGQILCHDDAPMKFLCFQLFISMSGPFNEAFNVSNIPYIMGYFPAGASTKTYFHILQLSSRGQFAQYDHGNSENMKIYGTEEPAIYDVKKITAPFALFWGKGDELTVGLNVIESANDLPNVVTCEPVDADVFNHLDFVWCPRAKDLLYRRVCKIMSSYL